MPGKSRKSTIVTFRIDNVVLAQLKKNHPNVSEYLRERVTYDITRKHTKMAQNS